VPPGHPQYSLRRVWLRGEEEQGFYFGFANEGLWPLCHIAHTRPRCFAWRTGNGHRTQNMRSIPSSLTEATGFEQIMTKLGGVIILESLPLMLAVLTG
jgi:trehalose 6-phosphate synthase